MPDQGIFSEISFPSVIGSCFDKAISIGWYDGTVSGVAIASRYSSAFKFDLVDWGPSQDLRIFALSPIAVSDFEEVAGLFGRPEVPKWPIWYPGWPSGASEQKRMGLDLDEILLRASPPEYVFASRSPFKTILAAKRLTNAARGLLPVKFDDQPKFGFDYWLNHLEISI